MTWQEMLARAKELFEEAKVIVSKGDEATPEEKENFQQRLDDAMALKSKALQLKHIEGQIVPLPKPAGTKSIPADPLFGTPAVAAVAQAAAPFVTFNATMKSLYDTNDPARHPLSQSGSSSRLASAGPRYFGVFSIRFT